MQLLALRTGFTITLLSVMLGLAATARPAAAETLNLAWDPSPDAGAVGYIVYVGTQSGAYGANYDVGMATSFTFSAPTAGQPYYFAVAAYARGPVIGHRSFEVSGATNAQPALQNPGAQSSTVGQQAALQFTGSDPERASLTYGASGLPPGLQLTPGNGQVSGFPRTVGAYLVTATVTDGALSDAQTFTWTIVPPATDNTAPAITVSLPTAPEASASFVAIAGTAIDTSPVTKVEWMTDQGRRGRATGTEVWMAGIPLRRGRNTITIKAFDGAGNVGTRVIVVNSLGRRIQRRLLLR